MKNGLRVASTGFLEIKAHSICSSGVNMSVEYSAITILSASSSFVACMSVSTNGRPL